MTLALRALPVAGRGRKGPRELLLAVLHSRFLRFVSHPVFTIPLFIASLYGLYFTPSSTSSWSRSRGTSR